MLIIYLHDVVMQVQAALRSIKTLHENIISQLVFTFAGRNSFISMESLWRHFKNSKTTHDAYLVHIYQ
jgi:hypothetical protein